MQLTYFTVFISGLLTFLAPCVLPVYPMYLSYISGMSLSELKDTNPSDKKHLLTQSFFFVMGLSFVFLVIGFSASIFGKFMFEFQRILQILGGLLLFLMGLHLMGVLKLNILNVEKRLKIKKQGAKSFNSFFIGLTFGAGWTPCIGPVLASVYALGAIYPEKMLIFILIFILGFSIPFMVLSLFVSYLEPLKKHMNTLQKVNGFIFILMGILLLSGTIDQLSMDLTRWFGNQWF